MQTATLGFLDKTFIMDRRVLIEIAEDDMRTMIEKRHLQDPYLPQDRTKGKVYAWYHDKYHQFKWSKNPHMDYSKQGFRFVCEFFNGKRTNLQYFRNNAMNRANNEDLSHCYHRVIH